MNYNQQYIGVTRGMFGWMAVLYDDAGAIQTGLGQYDLEQAEKEAWDWYLSECNYGVKLEPSLRKKILGE